ncbi:hypothetical protein DHW03_07780 [Pedobacter yonginense]|uniref:Uncharacterized protein n=1 Tax=Pedobacter yonginense TaxID=651869 RepID=A0A317ENM2_9SPHI|nr:hypothetical protein DHW03_07780 [Pedobacter yonginense]
MPKALHFVPKPDQSEMPIFSAEAGAGLKAAKRAELLISKKRFRIFGKFHLSGNERTALLGA